MKIKHTKAIVWDLDGTIIHFNIDYMRARRTVAQLLKEYGIPKHCLTVKKSIYENIITARHVFESMNFSPQRISAIIQEVDDEISKIEYEAALNAEAIIGIGEVLEFVRQTYLKQAIYTFNRCENAKKSLEKVGFLHYFDVIVGRNNVNNPKPHPDHILYICNKLGVNTSEVIVIGDHFRDIEGALNVNARSIALHTKLFQIETLHKADMIVEEKDLPSKLIQAIQELL